MKATPALKKKPQLLCFCFFFGSQKVPFFRGLMLGCGISFVAAKLNPHYGGFSLKINLWIFGPSADNIKM